MSVAARLQELGLTLPEPPAPVGAYVPVVEAAGLWFVSGQLPMEKGALVAAGKVGADLDIADAQDAARLAVLNGLGVLRQALGDLQRVTQVVRLEVFVNSAPGFTDQAMVANGASNLLQDVFGPRGRHARLAVGVAELPLNAAVELALVVAATRPPA